jgi:uncharacterized protein
VKLLVRESESHALRRHIAGSLIGTSEIALVEVLLAVRKATPEAERSVPAMLDGCLLVPVSRAVLERASVVAGTRLRSLDAIHLASAIEVAPDALVSYDERLNDVARATGLVVQSPGAA